MGQFRVHMNFLQIKQVIYIKNLFLFYFYLNFELTGLGLISWKVQGSRGNNSKTQGTASMDRGLDSVKCTDLFVKRLRRRDILACGSLDRQCTTRIKRPSQTSQYPIDLFLVAHPVIYDHDFKLQDLAVHV
jgi:hypothetical protein